MAGRLTLIRSVITSSLLHSFAVYKWSASLLSRMERCMRNFLWTGSINDKKLVTIPWTQTCLPLKAGGIGIKQLKSLNEAMLSKLAWKIFSSSDYPISML